MVKRHEIRTLRGLASNRDRLFHPKSGKEKERKLLVESFREVLAQVSKKIKERPYGRPFFIEIDFRRRGRGREGRENNEPVDWIGTVPRAWKEPRLIAKLAEAATKESFAAPWLPGTERKRFKNRAPKVEANYFISPYKWPSATGRGTTADQVSPNNASAVVTDQDGAERERGEPEGPLLGSYGIGKTYDSANEIQNATSQ
ncbi:hypothetical protein HZH66_003355 [Vespula vulgaris]|uniref:Uncharacterized protein n=1 Tax=Vespula vulgaris TaxID=7454 RepID=A0A834KLE9_VESVU|nr:hypothetical protein HZH66_003355 [Vespula vulgaris]